MIGLVSKQIDLIDNKQLVLQLKTWLCDNKKSIYHIVYIVSYSSSTEQKYFSQVSRLARVIFESNRAGLQ